MTITGIVLPVDQASGWNRMMRVAVMWENACFVCPRGTAFWPPTGSSGDPM